MKTLATAIALLAMTTPAFSGNLASFEEPAAVEEAAPMGGSNAAWIVPLIAIIAIAASSSSDDQPRRGLQRLEPLEN